MKSNSNNHTTGTIVAIDPGKYKSVACVYTRYPVAAHFTSFTTDRAHLRQLFVKHRPAAVVIEACLLAGRSQS
jgi:hypothetical protein